MPGRRRSDAEPLGSVYRLRQEPVAIGDALLRAQRCVGLVRVGRLFGNARPVLRRGPANGIDHLEAARPAARHDDHARPVAGADEHVMRPGRAVDEVPGLALWDEALLGRLHFGFGHRRIVHETPPLTLGRPFSEFGLAWWTHQRTA